METNKSNVMITAKTAMTKDGTQEYQVEINGLDGKVSSRTTFLTKKDVFEFLLKVQSKLNLHFDSLVFAATSAEFLNAHEAIIKAQQQEQKAVDDTKRIIDEMLSKSSDADQSATPKAEAEKSATENIKPLQLTFDESKDSKSPIVKQWQDLKKKHPEALLLFRCGDFYETYYNDAEDASKILGITLTRSNSGTNIGMQMAGFPYHALDSYLPRLIRAGKRVAICDQIVDTKTTTKSSTKSKVMAS